MQERGLKVCKFKLQIEAKGYWFTAGGEKGSFGYYPHLKEIVDGVEYPVYPDTQIHGNLKSAAFFLSRLLPEEYPYSFVSYVFGDENKELERVREPSKVFVTDLVLTNKEKWSHDRFQLKSRISVSENRKVEEHMLVTFETAYLEGLKLESDIYIYGEFTDKEFEKAKNLLKHSASYLAGFGAFRSRGYGRFKTASLIDEDLKLNNSITQGEKFLVKLKSLVHFRNRQIIPGTEQTLKSEPFISSEKLKAWIAKGYNACFHKWLDITEIEGAKISYLYPAIPQTNLPTYPVPFTTLKDEEGKIFDTGLKKFDEPEENIFPPKTKTLSEEYYITNSEKPVVYKVPVHRRIRNSLDEYFRTLEKGGLIMQEFIPKGIEFIGTLELNTSAKEQIIKLITEYPVLIKGCIFEATLLPYQEQAYSSGLYFAAKDIYFNPEDKLINKDNKFKLATSRSYNTTLNRQRRPKIVIQKGSVLTINDNLREKFKDSVLFWKGSGISNIEEFKEQLKEKQKIKEKREDERMRKLIEKLNKDGFKKAQAGFLRGFLNEKIDVEYLKKLTQDRIEKYQRKNLNGFKELYSLLKDYLDRNDKDNMRKFIKDLLEELNALWWDEKKK